MFDTIIDMGLQNLKTACWMAEQNEKLARNWMEHNAVVRKETLAVATRVAEQVKQNSRQWTEFTQTAMKASMEAWRPQPGFYESFFRAPAGKN